MRIQPPEAGLQNPKGDSMCRDMITMPLRIAACATRLGVRVTEQAAERLFGATRHLIEAVLLGDPHRAPSRGADAPDGVSVDVIIASPPLTPETTPDPTADVAPAAAADVAPAAAAGGAVRMPPTTSPADAAEASSPPASAKPVSVPTAPSQPAHVSEELQFVEGFAEPGVEDGAGAEVHVREPWNGYAPMTANEVIARLDDATREQLAAVILYERVHRRRRTVLAAAERQLRRATAGRPSWTTTSR